MDDENRLTAIQAVADRVTSWQDGATEGTVLDELRNGAGEVGVEMSDDELTRLVAAIEERHAAVDVREVLAG
ncbi:hypothetical protein [Nocardioides sp.]|uniref:hypothetical protein n=1 Tax=Nocardioides sp. TaxID=35761 RepID=UPI003516B66D